MGTEPAGQEVIQHASFIALVDGANVAHESTFASTVQDIWGKYSGECRSCYRAISSVGDPHPAWHPEAGLDYGLGKQRHSKVSGSPSRGAVAEHMRGGETEYPLYVSWKCRTRWVEPWMALQRAAYCACSQERSIR